MSQLDPGGGIVLALLRELLLVELHVGVAGRSRLQGAVLESR